MGNTIMDEESNQYRRDLLTDAIGYGDLRNQIAQGLEHHGHAIVAVVACSQSDPGRAFLRLLGSGPNAPVEWQRLTREALAVPCGASLVMPASVFLPLADRFAQSLKSALRDLLSRPRTVPVVVMGGGATMTAGIAAVASDGTLPQWVLNSHGPVWAVASTNESPGSRERERRAERLRRYGMN